MAKFMSTNIMTPDGRQVSYTSINMKVVQMLYKKMISNYERNEQLAMIVFFI